MDFEKIFSEAGKTGINLFNMAIYQNGQIWDHRFQPCSNCQNSYSVSKAFIMTGIGMLYDEGRIDVTKPIISYMGDLVPDGIDPLWQKVTAEHAMSHK
ncbi:MAG: serine hydrolase, partial [Clostridia bacterium]|nr:serine hydrolase [Clostridia bacterium]